MIKYKTRVNYRRKFITVRGWFIVTLTMLLFMSGLVYYFAKGNMALRQELVDNSNIGVTIR